MSTVAWDPDDRRRRLDEVLRAIDRSAGRGGGVDPSEWSERHPEFAREIRDHFAGESGAGDARKAACVVAPGAGERVGDYDLLEQLGRSQVVRCDEAALRIAGLSLAGWNVIVCLVLCTACLKAAFATAEQERYL